MTAKAADNEIVYRACELRAADLAESGEINLLCSTDAPVNMGGFREVLSHAPGAIEMESCRSVLLNHDVNQIIGGVRAIKNEGGELRASVFIAESAKTASGTSIRELVKAGALRGVSIGYVVDREATTYDERSNTVTVPKWALREITLTPTPADTRAQVVRSLPSKFQRSTSTQKEGMDEIITAAPAANKKEAIMADDIKPQEKTPDAASKTDHGEAQRAAEIAALREQAINDRKIVELAESHGLRASQFVGKSYQAALEAMLGAKAESEKTEVRAAPASEIQVGKSQNEKVNEAAVDGLLSLGGSLAGDAKDLGERGMGALDIARRHAVRTGVKGAGEWNRSDLAGYVLGKSVPGMSKRDAANVTSSNFNTVVLGNYMDKAVFHGFSVAATTWQNWCSRRIVSDFKTFASGALDTGNLVSTAENVAFPELTKVEGSYTSNLGLYGATVSLTFQALVNDDLGEFTKMLNRAGQIAARTIDKQVVTALEALTWTNNTTTGAAPIATAGNLDKVRAAFDTKTGPGGEKLGNHAKFLLAPSCIRKAVLQETTQLSAFPLATAVNTDLLPILSPHLTANGTAANSSYYLIADPNLVDTVTVAFLQGSESPMVMEYDAGAVAKRSWKIMQAFVAVGASTTVSSTIYIPGMQRGEA